MYINLMVTTNLKPTKHTQIIKRKEPKQNVKEYLVNYKRRRKKQRSMKTTKKQLTKGNKYILIKNYLNVNGLNALTKWYKVAK